MRSTLLALGAAAAIAASLPVAAQTNVQAAPGGTGQLQLADRPATAAGGELSRFVVALERAPAARYNGGVRNLPATAARRGERYNARSAAVAQYAAFLRAEQNNVLASVNATDRVVRRFQHAINGFTVWLTPAEAAKLRADKRVKRVIGDYAYNVETNSTPEFLGLVDEDGGLRKDLRIYGRNVIIGVMDTGAIQEHPSFSEDRRFDYGAPPAGWNGICQEGEAWSADDCNNKLIGARWFVDGFTNADGSLNLVESEFVSPRDASGHGSHVAGTAGGNFVVGTLTGTPVAILSGMAPRARIAAYKVCWLAPGADNFSCFFSDSAAATEAAVADGVDVLNFSVGTNAAFNDLQDIAFFNAAAAGVFIARSAGNDGPGFGTTPAGEPWVTTVAASTTDGPQFVPAARINSPESVAGDYDALEGAFTLPLSENGEITDDLVPADPILACTPLNNSIEGKIALVSRGECAFVDKIVNAVTAGASAVLVYTDDRAKVVMGGDASDLTQVPAVMIDREPGEALLAEIEAGETVNATLAPGLFVEIRRDGNVMAGFSSRGPYLTETDWLKPDITAPGVSILAATTPEPFDGLGTGELYGYLSGTSMSSPHIAGLGALVIEAHPDWSPAQVKSALMTTARQDVVKEDGVTAGDAFDYGAGHVDPNKSINPGLTYDLTPDEYLAASCGTATPLVSAGECDELAAAGFSLDPADLNLPSIAVGELAGTKTITRTVTAVADFDADTPASTYTAMVELAGFATQVTPSTFTIAPGETATYELTMTVDTAPAGEWIFGSITWTDELGHVVRSPIAVNASAFSAPAEIFTSGSAGSAEFEISFGSDGEYTASVHGINDPELFVGTVEDDPNNSFEFFGPGTLLTYQAEVPEGMALLRFELLDAYTSGNDDLDFYVYYCPELLCTLIGSSGNAASNEAFDVLFPVNDPNIEDPYVVFVHGFETEGQLPAQFALFASQFGLDDDAGNLVVTDAPTEAVGGESATVAIEWSGLSEGPGFRQLGAISHSDADGIQALTIISVDNNGDAGLCDLGVCEE